jgi:hypothetical protein
MTSEKTPMLISVSPAVRGECGLIVCDTNSLDWIASKNLKIVNPKPIRERAVLIHPMRVRSAAIRVRSVARTSASLGGVSFISFLLYVSYVSPFIDARTRCFQTVGANELIVTEYPPAGLPSSDKSANYHILYAVSNLF